MKDVYKYLWTTRAERNVAYLAFRIFTGLALLSHGWPKLMAGPDKWESLGGIMGTIGIPGPAVFWGFMAAFAESIGAILLTIGLLTPLAGLLIGITMLVAVLVAHGSDPFSAKELGLFYLFSSILFMLKGAGSFSLDHFLPQLRR